MECILDAHHPERADVNSRTGINGRPDRLLLRGHNGGNFAGLRISGYNAVCICGVPVDHVKGAARHVIGHAAPRGIAM